MEKKIQLIIFNGCPNADCFRKTLVNIGFPFEVIVQDDLDENHPLKEYSSPTILIQNEILVGSRVVGGGCSGVKLSVDQLSQKVIDALKK